MTETAWRNWAGNQRATPARFATPTDAADVATEIGRARRDGQTVRAVGSGHSFTGAAVTSGVMLRPDAMRGIVSVDEATGLVEVAAGTPLHELNPQLAEHGLALEIMGDIDRQTIAGAVSTGTHGSGRNFGSISTQVRGLELVLADGSFVTLLRDRAAGALRSSPGQRRRTRRGHHAHVAVRAALRPARGR